MPGILDRTYPQDIFPAVSIPGQRIRH